METKEQGCTHPNLRSFTFKDGQSIVMCSSFTVVPFKGYKTKSYKVRCTHEDDHRRRVLCGGK